MDFQVITSDDEAFIVAYIEGHGLKTVRNDHPNYNTVKHLLDATPEEIEEQGADYVASLFDPAEAISKRFEALTERVAVRNGKIYLDGDEMNGTLSNLIVRLMEEDEDFWPFVNFLDNVVQNPEEHSRRMAFDWIEAAGDGMAITDEGYVVGFKGVNASTREGYSYQSTTGGHAIVDGEEWNGYIPYGVGSVVEMPRSEVAFDPSASCSTGLHVGTRSYARGFIGNGGALLEVHVNPRDIVSVPEHEHAKMRVCRFTVAGVVGDDDKFGPLRHTVHVAVTESPYAEGEYGDGEEDAEHFNHQLAAGVAYDEDPYADEYGDEEPSQDFGEELIVENPSVWLTLDALLPQSSDSPIPQDANEEEEAFVGRQLRNPTEDEFAEMQARALRRHRGFVTYASTVGGWHLQAGTSGQTTQDWLLEA